MDLREKHNRANIGLLAADGSQYKYINEYRRPDVQEGSFADKRQFRSRHKPESAGKGQAGFAMANWSSCMLQNLLSRLWAVKTAWRWKAKSRTRPCMWLPRLCMNWKRTMCLFHLRLVPGTIAETIVRVADDEKGRLDHIVHRWR